MKNLEITVPLFIRMLEWARESARSDQDLHIVTEAMMMKEQPWAMRDYDAILKSVPPVK